ncbi:hypothetical protein CA267_002010 [Alteromonas pelagimontana]|uniref:Uncharacterized protein n=1 Tax=Alteromonas pelagimontana TaxID=1858656 RepID=A0A6M4MA15_9ALTE|nr:hypothetical protein [Alteromonas pelagimontana]QJR79658.1 hypothetical protein CA267_002010 [Alteromonas pelagimontana]
MNNEFNPTPCSDYGGLLKQFNSMRRMIKSLESTKSAMSRKITELTGLLLMVNQDEINSLRQTNERLTNRVLELENRPAEERIKERAVKDFLSNVTETGQFSWSDNQWLDDYAEEYADSLEGKS